MNTDESYEDEDLGPSKSEIKRQMLARQDLAEILADLSLDALKTIPLEDSLRDAIRETHRIRSFGAIKRHKQYLGKLMRNLDEEQLDAIQQRLDAISGVSKAETAKMHHLERMRDELLSDDAVLTKLIADYPDLDVQNLRTLIRNARKEKELNKPPKAYREIFQLLKSLNL
jgi:ribosome-associated protein